MMKDPSILLGRSGIVFLVRENGKRQKCGFRFHEGHIEVFDRLTRKWLVMPEILASQRGGVINVVVFDEGAEQE